MKKGNVLAVFLATVGIMLFGTLAVSADAHAGIQSASGKSGVPTAIAENESGAVTSAKASVGKSRKAKASANTVADSGLYQVKIAGDICPSAGSRAMDLINQYRKANGKSSIERDNTRELMAITRAGEISVYYNAMRPSGTAGPDLIIGFYVQQIKSGFEEITSGRSVEVRMGWRFPQRCRILLCCRGFLHDGNAGKHELQLFGKGIYADLPCDG